MKQYVEECAKSVITFFFLLLDNKVIMLRFIALFLYIVVAKRWLPRDIACVVRFETSQSADKCRH